MKFQPVFFAPRLACAVAVLMLGMTSTSFGSQEKILHAFLGHHASNPGGSLVFDKAGNLYGTSGIGGNNCPKVCGIVFELSPTATGWDYKVIYVFNGGTDGGNPAGLIIDAAGNLYGTTSEGGTLTCFGQNYGCGTVFELSPGANGIWTESILYRFTGEADGATPLGNVTMDAAGNLYGTAFSGGSSACLPPFGCGTVYELSPGVNGGPRRLYIASREPATAGSLISTWLSTPRAIFTGPLAVEGRTIVRLVAARCSSYLHPRRAGASARSIPSPTEAMARSRRIWCSIPRAIFGASAPRAASCLRYVSTGAAPCLSYRRRMEVGVLRRSGSSTVQMEPSRPALFLTPPGTSLEPRWTVAATAVVNSKAVALCSN